MGDESAVSIKKKQYPDPFDVSNMFLNCLLSQFKRQLFLPISEKGLQA